MKTNLTLNTLVKTTNYSFGICRIILTEEPTIQSITKNNRNADDFITLKSLQNHMTILLEKNKVLNLATPEQFNNELLKFTSLVISPNDYNLTWNKRHFHFVSLLKENSLENNFYVLKNLLTPNKILSFGERKFIQTVGLNIIQEYSAIFNLTEEASLSIIQQYSAHDLSIILK